MKQCLLFSIGLMVICSLGGSAWGQSFSRACFKSSPCPEKQVCVLNGCVSAPPFVKAVMRAMRASVVRHDLPTYQKMWAKSATLRMQQYSHSKRPEVEMTFQQHLKVKQIRYRVRPTVKKLLFAKIFVSQTKTTATLSWTAEIKRNFSSEVAGERYLLKKFSAGWKIVRKTSWPIRRSVSFNRVELTPANLRAAEKKARAWEKRGAWRQALFAYWNCWKYGDAYRLMKRVSEHQPNVRKSQLWLGFAALAAGHAEVGLRAFRNAWKLNPSKPLPDFVRGLADQKKPTSRPTPR